MKIAVVGLGKMGMQIVRKLAESEHTVIAHNRSKEPIDEAVGYGAIGAQIKGDVVNSFGAERTVVWLMITASAMDEQLNEWIGILPKDSIIVDGGNSDYRKTKERAKLVTTKGLKYVDVGTSGGVHGYKNGFSMMVGGEKADFDFIEPILKTLAQPEGAFEYFGSHGAGHFVKMTHNAIEYGMMQSLAEGYQLLKEGPYKEIDLVKASDVWQHHSVITSWLNELSGNALKDDPDLQSYNGVVAESGEARWAIETVHDLGRTMPAIESAFDVRLKSQVGETSFATKLLAAMRNQFGGHDKNDRTMSK